MVNFDIFILMAGIGIGLVCAGWITHPNAGVRSRLWGSRLMALAGVFLIGYGSGFVI